MAPLARSLFFVLLSMLALGGMVGLGGCAAQPTGLEADEASTGIVTPSDESDQRRRARTRLELATGYFENGQREVALDELKKVLQVDANYGDAYNLGGLIYMSLNEPRLAETNFQRAIALNPRDGNALHNLGWLQCQQRRYSDAAQTFQRAVDIPSYAERAKTLLTQGVCEARSGDTERAEQTLMRAYQLDAGNPVTAYTLAQLMHTRGDDSRAQFYIRRLNNSELANAESLWLGLRIERRLGNDAAVQQLGDQLRRRFPSSNELVQYERRAFHD